MIMFIQLLLFKLFELLFIKVLHAFREKNPNGVSKEDYQKLYKTAKNNVKLKECENFSLKQEVNYAQLLI